VKTDASTPLFSATKLAAIVKKHAPAPTSGHTTAPPPAPPSTDPIGTLVHSFLLWEASTHHASGGTERIAKECVDFNELRVCLPDEIVSILGPRYPFAEERATRLRRSLNDIYRREHKISLEHIASAGKRDQRNYIENLDGMIPFVASRVLLFHFGQAGVPADDQLVDLLRDAKALTKDDIAGVDLGAAISKSTTSVDEALRMHAALIGFADAAWDADSKTIMKAKQVRAALARTAEIKAAKIRAETAKIEAAKAEVVRIAEEKAAAAARKAAKPEAKKSGSASKWIEAKPAAPGKAGIPVKPTASGPTASGKVPPGAAKAAAAKPQPKPEPKPESKPVGRPSGKPLAKPLAKAASKPASKPAGKPAAKPAVKLLKKGRK